MTHKTFDWKEVLTKKEAEELIAFAEDEVKQWREFIKTVKKKIKK